MARLTDFHRDYWDSFQHTAEADQAGFPSAKRSNSYMIFRLGVGGTHLAASVLVSKNLVTFYLLLEGRHREKMYYHLFASKAAIDAELRETPVWEVMRKSNRARITVELNVLEFADRLDWPRQHRWIIENAKKFDTAIRRRLHEMKGTS